MICFEHPEDTAEQHAMQLSRAWHRLVDPPKHLKPASLGAVDYLLEQRLNRVSAEERSYLEEALSRVLSRTEPLFRSDAKPELPRTWGEIQ